MKCYSLAFYTLTLFTLFNIICVVQCQICNLKQGKLPQGWRCNGEPHVISKHKEEIKRYCGFNVSSTLPAKVTEKVSNGRPALPGELPFYASIAYKDRAACGAALIDNYHLVTAAHCVLLVNYEDPNGNGIDVRDLKVQMGTVYRYETKAAADDTNRIIRDVKKIYRHRGYVQGYIDATTENQIRGAYGGSDIAIIKLAEPMPFTANIWPICLVSEDLSIGVANQKTSPIILSGFGQDEKRDVKHVQLQVSKEIRLLEKDNCEKSIDSEYSELGYTFKDGQMCTVALNEGKAVGACKGDSGGPLAQYSRGRHYLLGLVSYGPGDCLKGSTKIPDVHTNVTYFQKWMNGIVTSKWDEDEYYKEGKIREQD
jgi:secreted trypsin-like serine protease